MEEKAIKTAHLSADERDKISILHAQNLSLRQIAKIIKRSPATISRELSRKEAVYYRGKYIGSHDVLPKKWSKMSRKKVFLLK